MPRRFCTCRCARGRGRILAFEYRGERSLPPSTMRVLLGWEASSFHLGTVRRHCGALAPSGPRPGTPSAGADELVRGQARTRTISGAYDLGRVQTTSTGASEIVLVRSRRLSSSRPRARPSLCADELGRVRSWMGQSHTSTGASDLVLKRARTRSSSPPRTRPSSCANERGRV